MYGQALVEKRGRYWPCFVPGDFIDRYFGGKAIGARMAYKQVIEEIDFFIHCQKDDGYVTKIMYTHGSIHELQGHATFWMVQGEQITYCYAETHSGHNKANHWVDAHNNRRHDPINIAETWRNK